MLGRAKEKQSGLTAPEQLSDHRKLHRKKEIKKNVDSDFPRQSFLTFTQLCCVILIMSMP